MIRESLQAMQKQVAGLENPLLEASANLVRGAWRSVTKVTRWNRSPVSTPWNSRRVGQLVSAKVRPMRDPENAAEYFARGVSLEEDPNSQDQAIAAYMKVLELDSEHAAAHIISGRCTTTATSSSGGISLLPGDRGRPSLRACLLRPGKRARRDWPVGQAVRAYRVAILLAPTYADAHYNLALAYEKMRSLRKALKHWRTYTKLDCSGPWAMHARKQIARTMETEKSPRGVSEKIAALLFAEDGLDVLRQDDLRHRHWTFRQEKQPHRQRPDFP